MYHSTRRVTQDWTSRRVPVQYNWSAKHFCIFITHLKLIMVYHIIMTNLVSFGPQDFLFVYIISVYMYVVGGCDYAVSTYEDQA